MLMQPKKIKYKKIRKGVLKKLEYKMNSLSFGTIGLKAVESGIISYKQIESARQVIKRRLNRKGKIWIRIFPNYPITRKPIEVRMGKGKGNPEYWAAVVEPGRIIFEIDGVTPEVAKEAMGLAAQKLPIKTKFVTRRDL